MTMTLTKAEPTARRIRVAKCCECGTMTARVMPKERGDELKLAICEVCFAVSDGSKDTELMSDEQFGDNVNRGWEGVRK